jgi:hypothetical protein
MRLKLTNGVGDISVLEDSAISCRQSFDRRKTHVNTSNGRLAKKYKGELTVDRDFHHAELQYY